MSYINKNCKRLNNLQKNELKKKIKKKKKKKKKIKKFLYICKANLIDTIPI